LSETEIAKFSSYIESDEHVKRFKENEGYYRSLTKSFKIGDDLNKLHSLFGELNKHQLIHPASLHAHSYKYPILPEHFRKLLPSDSNPKETAEFLEEPSPENLSSLFKKRLIRDDGLLELVVFLSSFYKESSSEYEEYHKILPFSNISKISTSNGKNGTSFPDEKTNSSYQRIRTTFPDAKLPKVLDINEPLPDELLNALKSCDYDEYKLSFFSELATSLGAYEISSTEGNVDSVKTKNLKSLKAHFNFLEFPLQAKNFISSFLSFPLPEGFVNSKAIDGFYNLCENSPLFKSGPISLSKLKFMSFAWLESIADSVDV
jgi:hypothetical protein